MASNSPNLNLPLIEASQSQKHVTANETFRILDILTQLAVIDRDLTAPPGSPAEGDSYLIAASPTGAWTGQAGKLALYIGGAWTFVTPKEGFQLQVRDENLKLAYVDGAWVEGLVSPFGALAYLKQIETELTLTGASVSTAGAFRIPDRSIVFSVASRTTLAITGAPSYGVGISGNTTQFGGSLGASLGSTNVGVIGPTAFYADTPVQVTATSGSFTAGKVRVTIQCLVCRAPTS